MTIGTKLQMAPSTVYRGLTKAGVRMRDCHGLER